MNFSVYWNNKPVVNLILRFQNQMCIEAHFKAFLRLQLHGYGFKKGFYIFFQNLEILISYSFHNYVC